MQRRLGLPAIAAVVACLATASAASAERWCGYANDVYGGGRTTDATVRHVHGRRRGLDVAGDQLDGWVVCAVAAGNCVAKRGRLSMTVTTATDDTATYDGTLTYARQGVTCDATCFVTEEDGKPNRRGLCSYACPSGPVRLGDFGFSRNCFAN